MNYITTQRARFNSISGFANLPYGTELDWEDGVLLFEGYPLCGDHSENAYKFFSRNDDGNGLERGKLIRAIHKTLEKRDKGHWTRWTRVWADPLCKKYKRADHADFWLWNHEFYNAEIPDLRHIASLVGAKGGT